MEVVSTWEGGYRCRVRVRDFELVVDEPEKVGGSDAGPTPTEMFLAAVASCFTMALAHVARKRGISLPDIQVRAVGEHDGPRFSRIRVEVTSTFPADEVARLMDQAGTICYVSNTLRQPVELSFTAPQVSHAPAPPPG